MGKTKKYWKGTEELENNPAFIKEQEKEFAEPLPVDEFLGNNPLADSSTSRRDFLKFLGFGVGAATLAACEGPVNKAIPYLNKPEEITPGVANWYASTYMDGKDFCPVLVKTREGRPIHIDGNKMSSITHGAVNARVQASVLSLYDSNRLEGPVVNGELTTWDVVDGEIGSKLAGIKSKGGSVRIMSSSLSSPSTRKAIADFAASFDTVSEDGEAVSGNVKHVVYDAVSYYGIRKANELSFGKSVVPSYSFDKAKAIVSVGADFLSTWLAPIEFAHQYGQARKIVDGSMAKHIQFEANLSLTGSNADNRYPVKPSQYGAILTNLYNEIAKLVASPPIASAPMPGELMEGVMGAANHLLKNKGSAILVCGSNDPNLQVVANGINKLVGSYGNTINVDEPMLNIQSDDAGVADLIKEMNAGNVDALILYNVNPSYSLPNATDFDAGLEKVELSVSFADRKDETAAKVNYICPDHHYLESWNDANPRKGEYGLAQPTIAPLFNTRQAQSSLLKWAGKSDGYLAYIQDHWREKIFPDQEEYAFFESFWNQSLHNGVFKSKGISISANEVESVAVNSEDEEASNASIQNALAQAAGSIAKAGEPGDGWEVELYEKTGLGNGSHANNPWLQELPDPVSKVCWDNYITMNPSQMKELGFNTILGQVQKAAVVELTVNGVAVQAPVYPQYGQAKGTIGLALGYGRTATGSAGDGVGKNAYPLTKFNLAAGMSISYSASGVSISDAVGEYTLATIQTHHTMMGRSPVRETTLEEYNDDPASNNPAVLVATADHKMKPPSEVNLWTSFTREGHFWNLSIDLNACIGCGACVVACTSENNVPVVGKDEVSRSREMHWIRIDRYYSSDAEDGNLNAMEVPSEAESLEVLFQPIMCQHCNHAPCETVCPVAATTHSVDGLNQMIYNRCVGTKFCLNNCPYKVRRFNWFSYTNNAQFADVNPAQDDWGKMVLNPDVVVRSRGVMEKCSMCIQRIQDGKLTAKKEGVKLKEGDIQMACASACPTHAIIFGDRNEESSEVTKLDADPRRYYLLEELDTQPSVHYLTKVRNKNKA